MPCVIIIVCSHTILVYQMWLCIMLIFKVWQKCLKSNLKKIYRQCYVKKSDSQNVRCRLNQIYYKALETSQQPSADQCIYKYKLTNVFTGLNFWPVLTSRTEKVSFVEISTGASPSSLPCQCLQNLTQSCMVMPFVNICFYCWDVLYRKKHEDKKVS